MVCPKCGGGSTVCKNSRYKEGTVYRRRACLDCDGRFTTIEVSFEAFSSAQQIWAAAKTFLTTVQNILDK